jgi:outer membrane protein assembly factor BamD
MKRVSILLLLAIVLALGCGQKKLPEEKTAEVLAEEGLKEFNAGNYYLAIDSFKKLKDWYPFSNKAILAELKIADSHYFQKSYNEAIAAYGEFVNLHPQNESSPYVLFQIGQCYFVQIPTLDRDQTYAQQAYNSYNRLIKQFPDNEYLHTAQANMKKCLQNLAGHELYVAEFYLKAKKYKAALKRLTDLLNGFPDVGVQHTALQHIAMCEDLLNKSQASPEEEKKSRSLFWPFNKF